MSASQRILGVKFMIEGDGFPVALSVALFAFLSVSPFVCVVLFVAGVTVHRRVFEGWREMTFLTFHFLMFAHQGEARLVMVERRFLP